MKLKDYLMLFLPTMSVVLSSCKVANMPAAAPPPNAKVTVEFQPNKIRTNTLTTTDVDASVIKGEWKPGPLFTAYKSGLKIVPANGLANLGLRIEMNDNSIGSGGTYTDIETNPGAALYWQDFNSGGNFIFLLDKKSENYATYKQVYRKQFIQNLTHNRFIRFTLYDKTNYTDPTANKIMSISFRYVKRISKIWEMRWDQVIYTPVLFRPYGTASGFGWNALAPGLGVRLVQVNTNSESFPFISLNASGSITNFSSNSTNNTTVPPTTTTTYQYSLTYGGLIDFGGMIQVGELYSAKEGTWYFTFGLAPQLFSQLLGSNKSK